MRPSDGPDASGRATALERLVFGHRGVILAICVLLTMVLGWSASHVRMTASFDKTIPHDHPYMRNYDRLKAEVGGDSNVVRIAVESRSGSIFDEAYLDTLRRINDEVFLLPGVDRSTMKSLWTPSTRWSAVTEEGIEGGPVMPDPLEPGAAGLAKLRDNILRSGEIGFIIAPDFRSTMLVLPLLELDPRTDAPLSYDAFARSLEDVRTRYDSATIALHITGFAKVVGDMIDGLREMLGFFAVTVAIAAVSVFAYTGCWRSTLLVILCSLVGVTWQIGAIWLLGGSLNPYSVLVPFLVFAIGMSHGAQKMNGIIQDVARGAGRLQAARLTFRRLFFTGLAALVCDAVGFAVMVAIDIPVIREMAAIASLGVAFLVFTNLVLLPVLLSIVGVSPAAVRRRATRDPSRQRVFWLWRMLDVFTRPRPAALALLAGILIAGGATLVRKDLAIGDLDAGAPELRPNSRYNRDAAFTVANYSASSDVLVVMIETAPGRCTDYAVESYVEALGWHIEAMPHVLAVNSLAVASKQIIVALSEGAPRWYGLSPDQAVLNGAAGRLPPGLFNRACSVLPVSAYLSDHRSATVGRVIAGIEDFARTNHLGGVTVSLAAGNAGVEAATNDVVAGAMTRMLLLVYAAVAAICIAVFRSWRVTLAAVLPLALVSLCGEALMVWLGIGVKVATLPVVALGAGIGVDYSLYVLSVMLPALRAGAGLSAAYLMALRVTGQVVMVTGATLAVAVLPWSFSSIKFQADMGLLLTFMFVANMAATLVLAPAIMVFCGGRPSRAQRPPVTRYALAPSDARR